MKGATTPDYVHGIHALDFNPRSREGSDVDEVGVSDAVGDFNPRSREGSDYYGMGLSFDKGISIHAPVKGATDGYIEFLTSDLISIHAPVKGATRQLAGQPILTEFQSTLP